MNIIELYKSQSITKKATIWYTLCNIIQKGISFIVIPIFVRLLTVAEYGNYVTFLAWKDIIIIFATLNLYCGVFTKALVDFSDDRDRYTSSMQALSTIITILLFVIYYPFHTFWGNILDIKHRTMLLMFIYYITNPALSFWLVRQRVEYKYIQMIIITILTSIATPICSIILFYITDWKEDAIIWGFLTAQILFGGYFYILNFYRGKKFYDKRYWFFALKYNIPLVPHYLSLIVLGQVDRIMIKDMSSSAKAGIYTLAYQVSQAMAVLTTAINSSFVPWFYERLKDKEYSIIKPVTDKLCMLVWISVFFIMLISPEIIGILGTESYREAMYIMPVTSVGVYCTFCYGFFSNIEFYYNATKLVMWASLSVGIVKILLNYITIPIFGYLSAGYTDLICYILFTLSHYIFMKKVLKDNNISTPIFNNRFIFLSIIAIIGFMLFVLFLYNYKILRYCLIIMLAITLIKYKNQIIKLLKFKQYD